MKQTAVEWLIERFKEYDSYQIQLLHNEVQQALEMEREQINDLKEQMALKDAAYSELANRYSHLLLKLKNLNK
jgi:sensor domain CHASE-containing protein